MRKRYDALCVRQLFMVVEKEKEVSTMMSMVVATLIATMILGMALRSFWLCAAVSVVACAVAFAITFVAGWFPGWFSDTVYWWRIFDSMLYIGVATFVASNLLERE